MARLTNFVFFFVLFNLHNCRSNVTQVSKTPLIVFTLSMSPDTETLAPKDIKRDPRKPPSFCVNFKTTSAAAATATDERNIIETSEFFIRGIEIADRLKGGAAAAPPPAITEVDDNCANDADDDNSIECSCGEKDSTAHDSSAMLNGLILKLDGYEMDKFGHLPGHSRTPTPSRGVVTGGGRCTRFVRRPPSPATEQVIRITMNNKK